MTGINYDDLNSYLYVSYNYGKNWKKLKGNLPNEPINFIREDENFEDVLELPFGACLWANIPRMDLEIIASRFENVQYSCISTSLDGQRTLFLEDVVFSNF